MLKRVRSGQIDTISWAGMFSILEGDTFDMQTPGVKPKGNLLLPQDSVGEINQNLTVCSACSLILCSVYLG